MEIGQKLYKSAPPLVLEYRVAGIRKYDDNIQYELLCLSCKHSNPCVILVGGKPDKLTFIRVLNDDDENPQHYWHNDQTEFYTTPEKARAERFRYHIAKYKEDIKLGEELLAQKKKNLAELESALIALETTQQPKDTE